MSSNNLLMCDKKRPEKLKDLTFHNDLNECLFNLVKIYIYIIIYVLNIFYNSQKIRIYLIY